MSTDVLDPPADPTSKPARSPRATSRRKPQADEKPRKVSFYLSPAAIRRLGVAASMEDTDKSKILEQVIRDSAVLRRWVVSDRARSGESDVEVDRPAPAV